MSQLSLDWGVRAVGEGKVVWALVPIRLFPAPPPAREGPAAATALE